MSTVTEKTRMAGLISGLDTESLVKAGSMNTKNALNARKQKLQKLQWKQEAYRGIIKAMSSFQSKYLDITSKNSIRANAVMKSNKATSSNSGLVATASASAALGSYSITSVQSAKAAKMEGTKASANSVSLDFSKAAEGNNTVKITLDGTTKNVTFQGGGNAQENFLTALNDTFGKVSNAKFSFDSSNKLTVTDDVSSNVDHIFTVGYSDAVGLKNDASNRISTTSKLGSLDFMTPLEGDSYKLSINGVKFSFTADTTIKDMMSTINNSKAGVKMSFSSLSQSFTLENKTTGAGTELNVEQTEGNLVNALFNTSSIGRTATLAKGLTSKTVDSDAKFEFSATKEGFASGDSISINGKKLTVSGVSTKQETEKITVDGKETNALVFTDNDGKTIYKYKQDDSNYVYAYKDGDKFEEVLNVGTNGKVSGDGVAEDATEAEALETLGIAKKNHEYTDDELKTALNDAYKAAYKDGKGEFEVSTGDDGVTKITFTPGEDEEVSASASGNISLADTGHTDKNGVATNYDETAYPLSAKFSDETSVSFTRSNGNKVTISGTGENGAVTFEDLKNSGLFVYDEENGVLGVRGTEQLTAADEKTAEAAKAIFGTSSLSGIDSVGTMNVKGTNAQMTINGVTLESANNSFTVDGTTFSIENVKNFTEADIESGAAEAITVDVTKDTSGIKEVVKDFVEAYNALLDTIHGELDTARPKKSGSFYDPLTEEQEEEMEQDEIDKWNEEAKKGMLYHDTTLSKVFSDLRLAVIGSSNGMTIKDFGIDTESDTAKYGKLKLDEDALDVAIEKYGDKVAEFFTDTKTGLGTRLNNAVNAAIDTNTKNGYPKGYLASVAGVENTRSATKNTMYNQMTALQKIIDNLNKKYESEQERLWKQYSKLETYMNSVNGQYTSIFGGNTQQG